MPFDKKAWSKEYGKKTKYKEYNKKWKKSPAGKKSYTIYNWKRRGLICDNYFELYDKYLLAESCDVCNEKFKDTTDRCMDHDHDTGLFRQFLCRRCNNKDTWKKLVS